MSSVFTASRPNGVRQGGILSPYLFNVYLDGLSEMLNTCRNWVLLWCLEGKSSNVRR